MSRGRILNFWVGQALNGQAHSKKIDLPYNEILSTFNVMQLSDLRPPQGGGGGLGAPKNWGSLKILYFVFLA